MAGFALNNHLSQEIFWQDILYANISDKYVGNVCIIFDKYMQVCSKYICVVVFEQAPSAWLLLHQGLSWENCLA